MANIKQRDAHPLVQEPGATNAAGPTDKEVKVSRETFRRSIGHGSAGGGKQMSGGETGDPTIRYPNALTWSSSMGRGGKFGTPTHRGKMPVNYSEDMSSYLLEY